MKNKNKKSGFTLIELLVVIVIIGILSGIGISAFKSYQYKAQVAVVQAESKPLIDAVIIGRTLQEKTLREITGSSCTSCSCRTIAQIQSDTCKNRYNLTIDRIERASGIDLPKPFLDPWGSPYYIDENQGESHCNTKDWVGSLGEDQTHNSNDIQIVIPLYEKCN